MNPSQEFYLCPICFHASQEPDHCHEHQMIHYAGYAAGDEQLKPLTDDSGHVRSHMPRWMLQQTAVAAS